MEREYKKSQGKKREREINERKDQKYIPFPPKMCVDAGFLNRGITHSTLDDSFPIGSRRAHLSVQRLLVCYVMNVPEEQAQFIVNSRKQHGGW